MVPSCRFACQLSKDFVEVYMDFSEPTCAHGQDLSSIETAQHGLERAHHITRTVSDDLGRKLDVQFLGVEKVCLADLLCTPIRRCELSIVVAVAAVATDESLDLENSFGREVGSAVGDPLPPCRVKLLGVWFTKSLRFSVASFLSQCYQLSFTMHSFLLR